MNKLEQPSMPQQGKTDKDPKIDKPQVEKNEYVGVKKNPDGTLDYSNAAIFYSKKPQVEKEQETKEQKTEKIWNKNAENFISKKRNEWEERAKKSNDVDDYEEYSFWSDVESDLYAGNNERVLVVLERGAAFRYFEKKKDKDEEREAILEVSKQVSPDRKILTKHEISVFLHDEYEKRLNEMYEIIDKHPSDYTEDDIKEWEKAIIDWEEQSNQVEQNLLENPASLIEKEIELCNDMIDNLNGALREEYRMACKEEKERSISDNDKRKREYVMKVKKLRGIRDSLFEMILEKQ